MTPDPSVTVLVTRTVIEGREEDYEAWVRATSDAASAFPGHQGVHLVRPRDGSRIYTLVFRFASAAHLQAWETSTERSACVQRAEELCTDTRVDQLTGLEGWFDAPVPGLRPPPRWKMVIVTFGVAFPTLQSLQMPFVTRRLSGWLYAERSG